MEYVEQKYIVQWVAPETMQHKFSCSIHRTRQSFSVSDFALLKKNFPLWEKSNLQYIRFSLHFPLVFDTQNGHRNCADFEQVRISLYLSLSFSRCAPIFKKCQCRLCTLNHCQLQCTKGKRNRNTIIC